MDIVRKQQKKSIRRSFPMHGTVSRKTQTPIQTFDKHLTNKATFTKRLPKKKIGKKQEKYSIGKKLFWFSFIIFILSIIVSSTLLVYKATNALESISDNDEELSFVKTFTNITNPTSYKSLNGFKDDRINILLLGRANTHKSGKDLTDTIMIASINTTNYTTALLSLPRDLLVSNGSFYSKINSLYQTGLRNDVGAKYITESVQKVTEQEIHYYFVLDFEGFTDIINILGGINVDVPGHIKDEKYPGPGYSYETFEIYPGLQKLDGATALKYARTRHDDINGDFGRAKRQQQVMQSARNKAFSLGTIMNIRKINELFDVLGEHVHTNITPNEIGPFLMLVKKIDTQNVTNVVVDAWKTESLLISARYYNQHGGISGLVPRIGNYKEIRDRANNIFNLEKIKQRQDEIQNENPKIALINATKNTSLVRRVKKSLQILGFDNIIIAKNKNGYEKETTVSDLTRSTKPFSLDELLKKIPAKKIDTTKSNDKTDFIIILGYDIVDMYTYTEISREELEDENAQNNDN